MKFVRHIFLFLVVGVPWAITNLFAQDAQTVVNNGGNLNVLYRNEMNAGLTVHSSGFGINYRRIRHITAEKKGVIEGEFVNMRHAKETRVVNSNFENSKGFPFGKLNTFHILRAGLGYQKTLFRKAERKSVEIRWSTYLGASIGFANPVYLEIVKETSLPSQFSIKEERYNPDEHFEHNIYGRAPYFRGINELKVHPGGYAKLGLSFEYADFHDDVKTIETGVILDAYPTKIPIMALTENKQFMFSLYVSILYGKRWF